ncbi:MAG: hypothetical protein QM756_01265 [Polyangiaceae bacterium]
MPETVSEKPTKPALEFEEFFAAGEAVDSLAPSARSVHDHAHEEELDPRPRVTPELLARRAHFRRMVTRVVGGLAAASALVFAKSALFPAPPLGEEASVELAPLVTQTGALTPQVTPASAPPVAPELGAPAPVASVIGPSPSAPLSESNRRRRCCGSSL